MLSATSADERYFEALRRREFARLDARDCAYLDYTGSALYAASQVEAQTRLLDYGIFGNPHSEHTPSQDSSAMIEAARRATLAFFDVDENTHALCFVANTSAAIKLVAESYPFAPRRGLALSADNHNSVNGVREYARRAAAPVTVLPLDATLRLHEPQTRLADAARHGVGLFAFPAQSNFSGLKYPLALVAQAQDLGWDVLLDAAAFSASSRLSLRRCSAQFTAISFYKMFGLPTGLGALIVRRDALATLQRPWFAGGTVEYASVQHARHKLRAGEQGFEDGTPNFLGIASVVVGLEFLASIGSTRLDARMRFLTEEFLHGLRELTHANGRPLARIYSPGGDDQGATIAFNILRSDGSIVPYGEFEQRARMANVALRGGCFCNPGASEAAFGFAAIETARCFDTLEKDFSIPKFAACMGDDTAVGALRASFGPPTIRRDIARALAVVASFVETDFVSSAKPTHALAQNINATGYSP